MNSVNTQEQISSAIDNFSQNFHPGDKCWKKYIGDVCCRIFREYLLAEIPKRYKISSPNAYIVGFPTEFDLLIIDENAITEKFTNAFKPENVKWGLEIKTRGLYGGRKILENKIIKIKQIFENVRKSQPSINFAYLTYKEVAYPKKSGSIRYLDETRHALAPYQVFCLKDSRTGKMIDNEWIKFITHIKTKLP